MRPILRNPCIGLLGLAAAAAGAADPQRQAEPMRYLNPGLAGVPNCQCSAGTALPETGGVVFSCKCGAMECVVVGTRADDARPDPSHSIACK